MKSFGIDWSTLRDRCCARCRSFGNDLVSGDGRPMEWTGTCYCPGRRKRVEADDLCPDWKRARWSEEELRQTLLTKAVKASP